MMALFGRMRLLGVGLLLATFIAGALSGAAVERVLNADEPERVEQEHDGDEDRRRSHVIDRIEMTVEQRQEIHEILERRGDRMRAVWREVEPRLDAITDSVRMEIKGVLTPEQLAEYERKLRERRKHRDRR